MSYWDIDQFLAEEQPISISFKKDAECLEFLDPQKDFVQGIPKQEPIDVSLWRGANLYVYCQENDLLQIKVPKNYNKYNFFSFIQAFRQASCANASKIQILNLRNKSPYFYEVAALVQEVVQRDADFAPLNQVAGFFNQRANYITNKTISTNMWKELDIQRKKLTNAEYDIYKQTFAKIISYNDWKSIKKQQRLVKKKV